MKISKAFPRTINMGKFLVVLLLPVFLSGCIGVGFGLSGGGAKNADEYIKGAVSKGFPGLPLYPKAQVIESYSHNGAYGATFMSGESLNKVVNFYNDTLPKSGWETNLKQNSDSNYSFDVKNATYTGVVIVNRSADPKKTAITMSLHQK